MRAIIAPKLQKRPLSLRESRDSQGQKEVGFEFRSADAGGHTLNRLVLQPV